MHDTIARFLYRLSPPLRGVLGVLPAALSAYLTFCVSAYYQAPYVLCFAAVIFSSWYLGMTGGVVCAITSGLLTDYFLAFPPFSMTLLRPGHLIRFFSFLAISILVGWSIRTLSRQREALAAQRLTRELELASADRRLLKEREAALQALHDRDSRLKLALQAGHVGLSEWDLGTCQVYWSAEYWQLLGLAPGSVEPSLALWRSCVHPEDLPVMDKLLRETIENGLPLRAEFRVIWPDGSVHWLDGQAQYELDSEGKPRRRFGVVADVTHRKQSEEKLLRTEKLAVAGRFAAALAHEINNPLEGMVNLLYLATTSPSLEEARRNADAALRQLMRISQITRLRLQFHKQLEQPRETRISAVLDEVINAFQARLSAAGVKLRCVHKEDPVLMCLAGDLEQILANLVANSLDAMPQGGQMAVRIRKCCDWRNRSRPGVRTTLVDSGHGMDIATRRRIYEPFFTTRPEIGTGLGMWITAEIVNRLGGDLRVWSSRLPGAHGTAYSLFLPERQQVSDVRFMDQAGSVGG